AQAYADTGAAKLRTRGGIELPFFGECVDISVGQDRYIEAFARFNLFLQDIGGVKFRRNLATERVLDLRDESKQRGLETVGGVDAERLTARCGAWMGCG